jgi:hypothetical protein
MIEKLSKLMIETDIRNILDDKEMTNTNKVEFVSEIFKREAREQMIKIINLQERERIKRPRFMIIRVD